MAKKATATKAKAKKVTKVNTITLSTKKQNIVDSAEEEGEFEGKIEAILYFYNKGFSPKEIVSLGYNRSTVYRQTRELDKLRSAPVLDYFGYEAFEGKVQRIMKAKKLSRAKVLEMLMAKVDEVGAE